MKLNINDRLVELRKTLKLKQGEFSKKLGMTSAAISAIEVGKNGLSETNIKLICLTFGVRDEWLRYGEGDMFDKGADNPIIQEVVELMEKMLPDEQQVVLDYVRFYAGQLRTLRHAAADADYGEANTKKTG
jgi:transcriptional regulator with XRE-family HTH domain